MNFIVVLLLNRSVLLTGSCVQQLVIGPGAVLYLRTAEARCRTVAAAANSGLSVQVT